MKKTKNKEKNLLDRQAFLVFATIIFFLVGLIATPYLYHQFFEKFNYAGISFEKIKNKNIVFYHGVFPIKVYAYHNLYFRNDPRINKIPINTNFTLSRNVSISIEPEATSCTDAILGQSLIGQFFNSFPWVKKVEVATNDLDFSKLQNWSYVTCNNASKDHTVFIVENSEKPSIEKGNTDNCYTLNVGKCEYLKTMERLAIGIVAQVNGKEI
jgi:hypothetical protein